MKKNIIVLCVFLLLICLYACNSNSNSNNDAQKNEQLVLENQDLASNTEAPIIIKERISSDFIFDVAPRFNTIKKSDLDKAKSFSDFITEEHANRIIHYKSLQVIILDGDKKTDTREVSTGAHFNDAQIKLLQAADYSTNILIWSDYREKSFEDGQLQNSTWTPYLTVVPEKQAEFLKGKVALIDYLDKNSEIARTNIEADKLKPARITFTVTKNGTIENVKLDSTSGYPIVDQKLMQLILETSGSWVPAENNDAENVDQTLTISYGILGC